jgi:hypothetical protein
MILKDRDAITQKCTIRFEAAERDLFWELIATYPRQKKPLKEAGTNPKVRTAVEKKWRETQSENSEIAKTFRGAGVMVIDKDFNEFWDLTISAAEMERLLQILNDIRVSLWTQIGCPDPISESPNEAKLTEDEMRARMLMHICGSWQAFLIHAFDSPQE